MALLSYIEGLFVILQLKKTIPTSLKDKVGDYMLMP